MLTNSLIAFCVNNSTVCIVYMTQVLSPLLLLLLHTCRVILERESLAKIDWSYDVGKNPNHIKCVSLSLYRFVVLWFWCVYVHLLLCDASCDEVLQCSGGQPLSLNS